MFTQNNDWLLVYYLVFLLGDLGPGSDAKHALLVLSLGTQHFYKIGKHHHPIYCLIYKWCSGSTYVGSVTFWKQHHHHKLWTSETKIGTSGRENWFIHLKVTTIHIYREPKYLSSERQKVSMIIPCTISVFSVGIWEQKWCTGYHAYSTETLFSGLYAYHDL